MQPEIKYSLGCFLAAATFASGYLLSHLGINFANAWLAFLTATVAAIMIIAASKSTKAEKACFLSSTPPPPPALDWGRHFRSPPNDRANERANKRLRRNRSRGPTQHKKSANKKKVNGTKCKQHCCCKGFIAILGSGKLPGCKLCSRY